MATKSLTFGTGLFVKVELNAMSYLLRKSGATKVNRLSYNYNLGNVVG